MALKLWSKIKLNQIRKDAKDTLFRDFNDREKEKKHAFTYLYILPVVFTVIMLFFGVFIEESIATYLITGISIFAGLFFSLLFVVNDKYNSRKELLHESVYEDIQNYLKRYKKFAEQLISQISYTIIIAFGIIILMSIIYFSSTVDWDHTLSVLLPSKAMKSAMCVLIIFKYLINGLVYYLCWQFILFIIVILSNTYIMLMDDIDFTPE